MQEYRAKHPHEMEPTHPGEILREDVLPALNLTVSEAARQLLVSRQMLHSILAKRSAVSPEMAVRLGHFCGNGLALEHRRIVSEPRRKQAFGIVTSTTILRCRREPPEPACTASPKHGPERADRPRPSASIAAARP